MTNHPSYNATFESDLLAIPSISIVMKQEDLFGVTGINSNPGGSGIAWERAASLELIYPDGRDGFQQDCGMRIQGGYGRSVSIKKHSFRPLFKADYGDSKLRFPLFEGSPVQEFDTFVLRAGMNNSYVLSTGEANRATFTEDEWMRQTQRAMGQVSGYGNFVHLYLNGLYWGLYNATERPSAPFAAAHFGGKKDGVGCAELQRSDRWRQDRVDSAAESLLERRPGALPGQSERLEPGDAAISMWTTSSTTCC